MELYIVMAHDCNYAGAYVQPPWFDAWKLCTFLQFYIFDAAREKHVYARTNAHLWQGVEGQSKIESQR